MKIILTGATGFIGGETLRQCLSNPSISSILALTRRALPEDLTADSKVTNIIHEDLAVYPDSLLDQLQGAEACIWTVGGRASKFPNPAVGRRVNVDYTLAAASAFAKSLASRLPSGKKFHFVFCSGWLAEREIEKTMWFIKESRVDKGLAENGLLKLQKENKEHFKVYMVRPAWVAPKGSVFTSVPFSAVMAVAVDQLGAVMADLAVNGSEEEVMENAMISKKGRELLRK